ncbi:MAG TPA: hypothetical protein VEU54_04570 [Steroidobacteraceae bacterium]|nr:hypothetical protein [Steroidobacteraceae bacterium]
MNEQQIGEDIEGLLARRRALEARSLAIPGFAERLRALRSWQACRLARTYEELRRDERYTAAVEFFLSDLYGPHDFGRRDSELTRAVTPLKRVLPAALLAVLAQAIELDVLTLELDQGMVEHLAAGPVTEAAYATAYRALGRAAARERQIDLTASIGAELERLVRRRWIVAALRAAQLPARAAGFGVLQEFLERGFTAFRRMGSARPLLQAIRERETRLMEALLGADPSVSRLLSPERAVDARA